MGCAMFQCMQCFPVGARAERQRGNSMWMDVVSCCIYLHTTDVRNMCHTTSGLHANVSSVNIPKANIALHFSFMNSHVG